MASYLVKVYRWDIARVRSRQPLDLVSTKTIQASDDHDKAKEAAKQHAIAEMGGGRVCGCSALAVGSRGFTVSVRSPES
jgi:hypothetical protein